MHPLTVLRAAILGFAQFRKPLLDGGPKKLLCRRAGSRSKLRRFLDGVVDLNTISEGARQ